MEHLNPEAQTACRIAGQQIRTAFLNHLLSDHFLFNTLNNIYGIARREGEYEVAQGVAELSSALRQYPN